MRFTTALSKERIPFKQNHRLKIFCAAFFIAWISTFIGTNNLSNWALENTLVVVFLSLLIPTYRKFKFSDLSYLLITIFLCLHVYGAMYTYAENPFGFWLQNIFHAKRNFYDRIVHFSFGFLLVYPMRDYCMNRLGWTNRISYPAPVMILLSFSALYELIEWAVAVLFFPQQGDAYLGTQGDNWDGQKDMAISLTGSVLGMLLTLSEKIQTRKTQTN